MKKILLIVNLCIGVICYAQQDALIPFEKAYKRKYTITKVSGIRPVMDGRLDEDFWTQNGEWSDEFVQVTPFERRPPESPTRMKLLYDDKYIYVGVWCKDVMPDRINRFIGNRDDNSMGDLISVAFDTYHDYRAAPEFNLNVGGNKTDLIVTDQLDVNRSWNAVWEGKAHVNPEDSCWTAELRIPFSQLRYNQLSEDGIWGLHIRRILRRSNEVQNWSMIPLKNNGHVFSFGEMHGMTDLPKSKGIEIQPYVMGKFRREPKIEGSPYQKGSSWNGDAGLDAKFALSDFTLDVTINPDFGQVELDPSVMNLTAFETFYDEKRPFFLEGKHILDYANNGDMMFYTRRIGAAPSYTPAVDNKNSFAGTMENVPIIGAMKLTGTNRNGLTVGVLQSVTARSSVKITADGEENRWVVEPLTNYTVARVQKNWKGNTLLGGMVTSVNRDLGEPHLQSSLVKNAFTGGLDFTHYFLNRLYYIDLKAMVSSLHGSEEAITLLQMSPVHYYQRISGKGYLGVDPHRTSLNGTGGYARIGRKGNAKWTFAETFRWSSPGFDLNDIGYMKQADNLIQETEIIFRDTDIWKIFRFNQFTLTQCNHWDYGGTSVHNNISLKWRSMTMKRYEWTVLNTYGWNQIDSRILRGGPDLRFNPYFSSDISFNTDKWKRTMFKVDYNFITHIDGGKHTHSVSPGVTLRLGNHIYFSGEFNYSRNKDGFQYVTTFVPGLNSSPAVATQSDPVWIMGTIEQDTYGLTLNMQVNLTPDFSLQFYGSPFTSNGRYTDFKKAADTKSVHYDKRFVSFLPEETTRRNQTVSVDSEHGRHTFAEPDFTFNEFRSNLVARWEYLPGSTLYFVWEHRMSDRRNNYLSGWGNNLDRMFGLPSTNTFMVKVNYWFNL